MLILPLWGQMMIINTTTTTSPYTRIEAQYCVYWGDEHFRKFSEFVRKFSEFFDFHALDEQEQNKI